MPRPFRWKDPVESRSDFYGYNSQISKMERCIESSIDDSSDNFIFLGERSTGKSSFLNIAIEFCEKKGFMVYKESVLVNSFYGGNFLKFFDSIFQNILINLSSHSNVFRDLKDNYQTIIDNGSVEIDTLSLSLRFPIIYNKFSNTPDESSIDANAIIKDLEVISDLYHKDLKKMKKDNKRDLNGKIVVCVDDFQNIIGERSEIIFSDISMGEMPEEIQFKGAIKICQLLKQILDSTSIRNKYLFIFSSYNSLLDKNIFQQIEYMIRRKFDQILINQFESTDDTERLIIGAFKNKLKANHPIRKKFIDDIKYKPQVGKELERLVNRVHGDSEGRPFDIKKQMDLIYTEWEDNNEPNVSLIRYADSTKISKKLIENFETSRYHQTIKDYSLTEKYMLSLLIFNPQLNINEIIELQQFHLTLSNTSHFSNETFDLAKIDIKSIEDYKLFFGEKGELISYINENKLDIALEKFTKDGIIAIQGDEFEKYKLLGELKDTRYTKNYLISLGLKITRGTDRDLEPSKIKLTEKYFEGDYYLSPIQKSPDIPSKNFLPKIEDTIDLFLNDQYPTELKAYQKNIIEAISSLIYFNIGILNSDFELEFYYMIINQEKKYYLGFNLRDREPIMSLIEEWSENNDYLFYPIRFSHSINVGKGFSKIYRYSGYKSEDFLFNDLKNYERLYILLSNPQSYWIEGDIDRAFDMQYKKLRYLSFDLRNPQYFRDFNNGIYYSLCQNKPNHYKKFYHTFNDQINDILKADFVKERALLLYNTMLLAYYLGDDSIPKRMIDIYDNGPAHTGYCG